MLTVPVIKLFNKAVDNGFAVKRKSNNKLIRATSKRSFTANENAAIVQKFNSIISGLINYYSFVSFKSNL